MRIAVTGAAGFIGSNIVAGLNSRGIDDVIAVDDLTDGVKFRNLADLAISDYFDRSEFYDVLASGALGRIDAVFHEGACSDTMEHNGRFMLDTNYRCSKRLLDTCVEQDIRLIYASSAAVYGADDKFVEDPSSERPLNVYGYSKLLFDQVVRRSPQLPRQIAGLRYFNVYGPRETHKGRMASVAFHHFNQFRQSGKVRLFGEYGGYGPGGQSRDFVYIDDVVAVNLWLLDNANVSGVFNVGAGRSQPFNDVAHAVVNACRALDGKGALSLQAAVESGAIEYIPFPAELVGKYQCFTRADMTRLRAAGCNLDFNTVATGVENYVQWLERTSAA